MQHIVARVLIFVAALVHSHVQGVEYKWENATLVPNPLKRPLVVCLPVMSAGVLEWSTTMKSYFTAGGEWTRPNVTHPYVLRDNGTFPSLSVGYQPGDALPLSSNVGFAPDVIKLIVDILGPEWRYGIELRNYGEGKSNMVRTLAGDCDFAIGTYVSYPNRFLGGGQECNRTACPLWSPSTGHFTPHELQPYLCCMDFGASYLNEGLSLIMSVPEDNEATVMIRTLQSPEIINWLAILLLGIVAMGCLVAELERRNKDSPFHSDNFVDGSSEGAWWALVTTTTVGYGDLHPTTTMGRSLAMLWMLIGLLATGTVVGTIASAIIEHHQDLSVLTLENMADKTVLTSPHYNHYFPSPSGVNFVDYYRSCIDHQNPDFCRVEKLATGEVDAIFYKTPTLLALRRQYTELADYPISDRLVKRSLGPVIPTSSPIRPYLNSALGRLRGGIRQADYEAAHSRWFGNPDEPLPDHTSNPFHVELIWTTVALVCTVIAYWVAAGRCGYRCEQRLSGGEVGALDGDGNGREGGVGGSEFATAEQKVR